MRKTLHLFLLCSLFLNQAAVHAFAPGALGPASKTQAPSSYLAAKGKLSPCEINFVKLLNGQIPAEIMGSPKTSLWNKQFSERNYLDELAQSEAFASKEHRVQFLEDLVKFVHKDEVYAKNIAKLANQMKNEGMVTVEDLTRIFTKKDFPFAKFSYSHNQKGLLASVSIDPAKSSLIESIIDGSKLGKNAAEEYRQILRGSEIRVEELEIAIENGLKLRQDAQSLETFRRYIEFLDQYAGKRLGRAKIRSGMENIEKIYDTQFDPKWYEVDRWLKPHKKFLADTPANMNREEAIKNVVKEAAIPAPLKREYENILRNSRLTQKQIELAQENGMVLRGDQKSFERFKEYMAYLDYLPEYRVNTGVKNIEKIYKYADDHRFYIPSEALTPHKQFIAQRRKVAKMREKRENVILRDFKMQEKDKLMSELDGLIEVQKRGAAIDENRLSQIRKEVDSVELSPALLARAKNQARGEASIFRKLVNGCNGGGSARLASATKKFKNFKLALTIGGTPLFYLTKNWDKKDTDEFFWEKLGQEMAIGLFFTFVGNKIVTNTNKGFWGRYLEGYVKFSGLDILSAGSYELLFGPKSYIRHFQQIYKGGPLAPNAIEEELEKLKNSPTFEEDVQALLDFLEEKSETANFKNFLDKHFNLSTYSSLDDEFKITQEDLETEEGREVMLELMAEKMYMMNMGGWPVFQTGNSGADRWSFYRARNVLFDMKGMALNIAMFEIMCREPMGKIGSWGLVLGLAVGDWLLSGKVSYNLRREAINQ